MTRVGKRKRGKGRVYTILHGGAVSHAAAENVMPVKSKEVTVEIASYSNDYLAQNLVGGVIPNPDEIMRTIAPGKLNQYQKLATDPYALHEQMRRSDLKYKSLIQTRKNGVLAKEWEVEPNAFDVDTDRAVMVADFVEATLKVMENFHADLDQLLDAIPMGFSVLEIIWEQKTITYGVGKSMEAWVPVALKQRRQGLFGFAEDWSLRFQKSANTFVEVPPFKFIVHTHNAKNENRYGTAECSEVFWAWLMKHYFTKWWAVAGEKFGMPTVLGKYPGGWDDGKVSRFKKAISKFQTEFGIVIPDGAKIELLEGVKSGNINTYQQFNEWCDKCMSEALTGQSLATGQGQNGAGSYSQSQTHGEVKQEYIEADSKGLMGTLNPQLVAPLVWFNFGADTPLPTLVIKFESKDLAADLAIDERLVKCGVELPLSYFYSKYGRPMPVEGEPVARISGGRETKTTVSTKEDQPESDDEEDDGVNDNKKHRKHAGPCAFESAAKGRVIFAANAEDEKEIRRRLRELERMEKKLGKGGAEVLNDLGRAIEYAAETAVDLPALREQVQRFDAGGIWRDLLADELAKAKVNAYLLAAAQIQRYTDETLAAEAEEDEAAAGNEFARRAKFEKSLTDLLAGYEPLEPSKALDWFNNLVPMPKDKLQDLPREAEKASITVADIESQEVLGKVKDLIAKYIQTGGTLEEFKKEYQALRQEWGLTLADNHKVDLLFRSEIGRAYGAGRTVALRDEAIEGTFPLWEYIAVDDDRTRDEHRALSGFVAAPDDPVWLTKNPPWDYNCRCDVIPLTRRQIEKRGIVEKPTVTMPDGSEVDPRTWLTSPGYRGLGF